MKHCSKCGEDKQVSSFPNNKSTITGIGYWCKECCNKQEKLAYANPRVRLERLARARKAYQENPEKHHKRSREKYAKVVRDIFEIFGGRCNRCGFKDKRVLQIDHINGGGSNYRKKINGAWWKFYGDVKKSLDDKKNEYQLLCANCNWIEGVEKGYRKSIWS